MTLQPLPQQAMTRQSPVPTRPQGAPPAAQLHTGGPLPTPSAIQALPTPASIQALPTPPAIQTLPTPMYFAPVPTAGTSSAPILYDQPNLPQKKGRVWLWLMFGIVIGIALVLALGVLTCTTCVCVAL